LIATRRREPKKIVSIKQSEKRRSPAPEVAATLPSRPSMPSVRAASTCPSRDKSKQILPLVVSKRRTSTTNVISRESTTSANPANRSAERRARYQSQIKTTSRQPNDALPPPTPSRAPAVTGSKRPSRAAMHAGHSIKRPRDIQELPFERIKTGQELTSEQARSHPAPGGMGEERRVHVVNKIREANTTCCSPEPSMALTRPDCSSAPPTRKPLPRRSLDGSASRLTAGQGRYNIGTENDEEESVSKRSHEDSVAHALPVHMPVLPTQATTARQSPDEVQPPVETAARLLNPFVIKARRSSADTRSPKTKTSPTRLPQEELKVAISAEPQYTCKNVWVNGYPPAT
jgi:hypothetical protein